MKRNIVSRKFEALESDVCKLKAAGEAAAEAEAEAAAPAKELKAKKTELNRWQRTLLLLQQIPTEADDKIRSSSKPRSSRALREKHPATRRMRVEKPTGMVTGLQWQGTQNLWEGSGKSLTPKGAPCGNCPFR